MKAARQGPWARAVHAALRAGEAKWGKPFGMTLEELCVQLGPPPFDAEAARGMLARMVECGWLRGVRESAQTGRKGGSQVRVRFFAAADMPPEKAAPKQGSYFDGLVRACSVFELAQVLGGQAGQSAGGGVR